ncbi:MAG: DUF4838 domain-containing protein, partial [Verrucomicrobia bacterium]|nr:DUF4838 domain-containing protein [Verrucomicrobiota bacterium]
MKTRTAKCGSRPRDHEPGRAARPRRQAERQLGPTAERFMGGAKARTSSGWVWLLVSALAVGMAHQIDAANLTLATHSQTRYRIVIAADAIPSERYAAEELQRYLEKMSDARLPIVRDTERAVTHEILLGDNAHLRRLGLRLDLAKLGQEGFILRTYRGRLIIAGGQPRGTLYGVYELLEEKLGVRWFTPEVEYVPPRSPLRVPALDETRIPTLEYREDFWTEALRDVDFAARHRLNGNHYRLDAKHGGRAVVYYPFVHSLDLLVPRSLYAEHPEYFPLINGKRVNGYVQRCLSNPEVLKIAIANVRRWIQDHPEATIISVSQNDTFNYCQCEQCQALDDAEGSHAATLLRFVNAIAANLEPDYPNIRIDTLAYQYTRRPPKTIRPRRNVIVRLCSIECCFAHPLATCPSEADKKFRDDIIAWQPVAPRLYVWDYTPNFAHYEQPFPNFDALQPNVQFFVQHGVKGLFEQGNSSAGGYGEMGPLRAYVLARLLWNPDTDVPQDINEFLHAYYGSVADRIHDYLELLHRS